MKILINLLTSLIIAGWISLIAVISIQNITEVSLGFLWYQSVELPLGVLLTFSVGVGLIIGAFLPIFLTFKTPKKKRYIPRQPEPEEYLEEQPQYDPIENWEDFETETW